MTKKRPSDSSLRAVWIATLLLALSGTASATSIDFVVLPGTGVIDYGGTGGPLTGVDIGIDFVVGNGTSVADGIPFDCIDCALNFVTGNIASAIPGPGPSAWIFDAGGPGFNVTITGGIDVTGNGVPDIVSGGGAFPFLLAGAFVGPTVTVDFVDGPEAFGITAATLFDVKHPLIANLYELPGIGPFEGALTLEWGGFGEPPSAFRGVPARGLLQNRVPAPSTALLLIVGALGYVTARQHNQRRRK